MYSLRDVFNALQVTALTAVAVHIGYQTGGMKASGASEDQIKAIASIVDDFQCLGSDWGWTLEKVEPDNEEDYRYLLHIEGIDPVSLSFTPDLWDEESEVVLSGAAIALAAAYIKYRLS